VIIRTTDYADAKFLAASNASNFAYFDGLTFFAIYFGTSSFGSGAIVECKLPAKPSTWAADLGVSIPPAAHQLNAPLELVD
jgi:hypothetical protein